MATQFDSYKHLDKDSAITVELSMEDVVRRCVALNYGTHRLLSALVHELRAATRARYEEAILRDPESRDMYPSHSKLADGIEALLNQGMFN